MTTYAEAIMRADAKLEMAHVPYSITQHLEYGRAKYESGEYAPHLTYAQSGKTVVDKNFRDSVTILPPDDDIMSLDLYHRVVDYAARSFDLRAGDEVGASTIELFAYPPGVGIKMHIDDHVAHPTTGEIIARDPYRSITVIVYLNDDFEGGEIYFNKQDLLIKPEPGLVVIFPSNRNFTHEVRPITSGMRFSYQRMYAIYSGSTGKLLA